LVLEEKAAGQKSMTGPAVSSPGLGFPAALALPLLGLAVYLVLYMNGLWLLGSVQLAPRVFYGGPIPQVAFATIISLGMSWYAAARTPVVLAGAAALFIVLSLVAMGLNAVTQQLLLSVPRTALPLAMIGVSLIGGVLTSVVVMLVAGSVAPALHRLSYWLVALTLWPFVSFLLSLAIPIVAVNWKSDPSSMQHLAFGVLLFRQCVIFGCIGYWLDRENRRGNAISRVF
jgi:hypothetical protein